MRARMGAVIAAMAVTGMLAGCTTSASGQPQRSPYRPLTLDSVTATMAAPVEDAAAYSRDGALVATRTDGGLCIGPADGEHDPVCADLDTAIGQMLFSPDGSTVAALEYYQQSFRGRLWLVSTRDGNARRVATPDFAAAASADATGAASAPAPGGDQDTSAYRAIAWAADGTLLALAVGLSGMAATDGSAPGVNSDHLIEVDADSGDLTDLGAVASGARRAAGTLIVGGGVALLMLLPDGREPPGLVTVDLAAGKIRTLTLTGDVIAAHTRVLPLAVAPGGHSALLWVLDPVRYVQVPPARLDLATGTVSALDGTQDLMPTAGAYSPDGSQLALIAMDTGQATNRLLVMPAEGGHARSVLPLADDLTPGTGLGWTRTDMLVPALAAGATSLDGLAPIQLAG